MPSVASQQSACPQSPRGQHRLYLPWWLGSAAIAVLCVTLGGSLLVATPAGQQVLHTLRVTLGKQPLMQPQGPQTVTTARHIPAVKVYPQQYQAPPPVIPLLRRPQVAIVIDDLGWDLHAAEALLALNTPFSFAILPQTPYQSYIAQEVQRRGWDVLLHLPMEPYGYPHIDPGRDALLSQMNAGELVAHIDRALQALPTAVGINNHMGSRLTENREAMRVVMQHLKQRHLFFLDSRTSLHSLAYRTAHDMGIRAAQRQIFLDHDVSQDRIAQRLYDLMALANTQGRAIGIGHPYPETLRALQLTLPALRRAGIEIVPVSHLVE